VVREGGTGTVEWYAVLGMLVRRTTDSTTNRAHTAEAYQMHQPGQTSTHPRTPSPYQKNTTVLNTYLNEDNTLWSSQCHIVYYSMWNSNALLLVDSVILLASHISRSDLIHHGSKSEIKSSLPNHLLELRPALRCFLQSLDKYVDK